MFCRECGNELRENAAVCTNCGVATGVAVMPAGTVAGKTRIAYILLGIFLGGLGIHNFYAGYTGRAIAQLLITLFTFWLIIPIICVWVWVLVEICTVTQDAQGNILS